MKRFITLCLLVFPLFAAAYDETRMAALNGELASVNVERREAYKKGEEVHRKLSNGDMTEEAADRAYDRIEASVRQMNSRKAAIESEIARLQSEPPPPPPTVPKAEPVKQLRLQPPPEEPQMVTPERPPAPFLMRVGAAILDFLLYVGGVLLVLFVIFIAFCLLTSNSNTASRSSTPVIRDNTRAVPAELGSNFGLSAEHIETLGRAIRAQYPASNGNYRSPRSRLPHHSGEMSDY